MKKHASRFCIAFNPNIPSHKAAIDILNTYGRNKANLIAESLQIYFEADKKPKPTLYSLNNITDIIDTQNETVSPAGELNNISELEVESDFEDEDINSILSAIDSFDNI